MERASCMFRHPPPHVIPHLTSFPRPVPSFPQKRESIGYMDSGSPHHVGRTDRAG